MDWLKRLWCRHADVEVRTFIEHGPCVRRTMKCASCGSTKVVVPMLSNARTLALLAQAEQLGPGQSVEV
jgi:hypothetical protein